MLSSLHPVPSLCLTLCPDSRVIDITLRCRAAYRLTRWQEQRVEGRRVGRRGKGKHTFHGEVHRAMFSSRTNRSSGGVRLNGGGAVGEFERGGEPFGEKRRIASARERSSAPVCVFTKRQRETATRDSEKRINTAVNSGTLCPASSRIESSRIASCRVATLGVVFTVA